MTGIDVNETMIRLLTASHRRFAGIADRPEVRLVHDDGRSFLTRSAERFDVIQMSLIDTWAATGAGAFSLSENGLYTTEAWRVVLDHLSPNGVFSVSRWFAPGFLSETSRLLALGTAADRARSGTPKRHLLSSRAAPGHARGVAIALLGCGSRRHRKVAAGEGFTIQVSPWADGPTAQLDRIAAARRPPA